MRDDVRSKDFWENAQKKTAFLKQFEKPYCLVLDSEYCSMGRMIAMKACESCGYAYYDAEGLLELLDIRPEEREEILRYDEILEDLALSEASIKEDPAFLKISGRYEEAIRLALAKGPCLIHERAVKERIEAAGYSAMSLLFYATDQPGKRARAKTTSIYQSLQTDEEFDTVIRQEDHKRRVYHNAMSASPWGGKSAYDLCLNTDALGREKAADLLSYLLSE